MKCEEVDPRLPICYHTFNQTFNILQDNEITGIRSCDVLFYGRRLVVGRRP